MCATRCDPIFPVVTDVVDTVLMVGVVAAQAGILGLRYLQHRDSPASSQGSSADLEAVDSRPATLAGTSWRCWASIALLGPALLSMSLVAVNPFGVPVARTDDGVPSAMAVAWPTGGQTAARSGRS